MASMQIVFATKNPNRMAEFWRAALGYASEPPPEGFETWGQFLEAHDLPPSTGDDIDSAVDPAGAGPRLLFERDEPRPRGAVHLDVNVGSRGMPLEERRSRVNEAVERFASIGATKTRVVDGDDQYWVEMTDPEGNWFCVQ